MSWELIVRLLWVLSGDSVACWARASDRSSQVQIPARPICSVILGKWLNLSEPLDTSVSWCVLVARRKWARTQEHAACASTPPTALGRGSVAALLSGSLAPVRAVTGPEDFRTWDLTFRNFSAIWPILTQKQCGLLSVLSYFIHSFVTVFYKSISLLWIGNF